jgi:shikimate kinase
MLLGTNAPGSIFSFIGRQRYYWIMKSIFLIGIMGAGKSYLARQLSDYFMLPAADLDHLIEKEEGQTVSEIFSNKGEAFFRQLESDLLRSSKIPYPAILATGGGTPCFFNNMDWMLKHGIVVWLNTPVGVLVERLRHQKAHRPLVAAAANDDELTIQLSQLLKNRTPWYIKAHVVLSEMPVDRDAAIRAIEDQLAQMGMAS